MKKISQSALDAKLQQGARLKGAAKPSEHKPEAAKPAEARPLDDARLAVQAARVATDAAAGMARELADLPQRLAQALARAQPDGARPERVRFKINRDARGLIESIDVVPATGKARQH